MRLPCSVAALCVLVVACACVRSVAGQGAPPAAGGHVHYAEPANAQASPTGALAPRLQNLGAHAFPVSTRNGQAQAFMSQGLNLAYAFNHAEARRAFREAARLDPDLAMAYWGQALVLGPEHQRDDGAQRRAAGVRAGAEGRVDEGGCLGARAGVHRRAGAAVLRNAPRIDSRATRRTRTRCGGCTSGSRTIWMPRCSMSSR